MLIIIKSITSDINLIQTHVLTLFLIENIKNNDFKIYIVFLYKKYVYDKNHEKFTNSRVNDRNIIAMIKFMNKNITRKRF